jgi:ATP-binding cassette subfamily A (ABC1) protein 3
MISKYSNFALNCLGKSTTISMLVGLTPPTQGNAYMCGGLSVTEDMTKIRKYLGVCPQHDILFPELTVMQHLQIYASFKGVPANEIASKSRSMVSKYVYDGIFTLADYCVNVISIL